MAVINLDSGWVYLANPHTASRATTAALCKLPGSIEVAPHHANLHFLHEEYPATKECQVVFHIVRHPLDWLVSRFLCTGGQKGKFRDWFKKYPAPIYRKFLKQTTDFGNYENLISDLARLTGHEVALGYDNDHKTQGKVDDYMWYWEQSDVDFAIKRFESDFDNYGYDKNIIGMSLKGKADYR